MSGPDPLLITFEILLTIVTPLLALYLRGQWPLRTITACLCGIPVLWYLTYAPIHELSHALGTTLVGGKVVDIKLIPSYVPLSGRFQERAMNSANAAGPDDEASVLETFTEYVNASVTLRDVSGRVGRPWLVAAILLAYAISKERWM